MNLLIRKALFEDVEQIFEIQQNLGLSYWSIEDYKSEVSNKDAIFFVATNEREVVGFILVRLITSLHIAEISNIGIKEQFQHQGIGKMFFKKIITELELLQVRKIELEVREQNTQAINFYKKMQFKQDGIRKNFYHNPMDNAILMSREV